MSEQAHPDLFEGDMPAARPWLFDPLERGAYSLIMIDPPWKYITRSEKGLGKSADRHYQTMTIEWIMELPVAELGAKDCVLWLWATAPMLEKQMRVLRAWDFKYVTSGVWVKRTKSGKLGFGGGYTFRNSHELVLIGSRGNPKYPNRSVRSVIEGPLREHSRKPDESYQVARQLVPYGRAADIFPRCTRPGWEPWGNEIAKFDEAAE